MAQTTKPFSRNGALVSPLSLTEDVPFRGDDRELQQHENCLRNRYIADCMTSSFLTYIFVQETHLLSFKQRKIELLLWKALWPIFKSSVKLRQEGQEDRQDLHLVEEAPEEEVEVVGDGEK